MRRILAPVGLEYFWARAATRKALAVAAKLPRGVVIATSPPHAALIAGARVARRLKWPLILDYRDPWSAYDWPGWRRGAGSRSGLRVASRAPSSAKRGARVEYAREHARLVRGEFSARAVGNEIT